jgi:ferredoxin--NADP+ reductase
MNRIFNKSQLSPNVFKFEVEAERIAQVRKPGQFVIVRARQGAERIPLTIADANISKGTITLVVQAVGKSTRDLASLQKGDFINDIAGPLGKPTDLIDHGTALCIGGGVGTAVVYPIIKGLSNNNVKIISVIGGRSKEWVIFEKELKEFGEVFVCTDDGSYGTKGFVTNLAEEILKRSRVDIVYAVGPVPMMRAVANLTRPLQVKTIVSLNPIMVDGTGMCGGCRVVVNGVTKFACVDGPEFDGHQVDFDLLMDRLSTYKAQERMAVTLHSEPCKLSEVKV